MNRKAWYDFWRKIRLSGGIARWRDDVVDPLEKKAVAVALINRKAVDGRISIWVDQMDCDCSRWTSDFEIPATWVHYEQFVNRLGEGAEGPIYGIQINSPLTTYEHSSRDLALEAFENGHPHVVYT